MPDLTGPLFSLQASGTIAKTLTYSRWRGIKYARQRVVPANPNTTPQQNIRNVFKNLNYLWLYAPSIVVASNLAASMGQPYTDRNLFIKRNAKNLYDDDSYDNFQPYASTGGAPANPAPTITPTSSSLTVDWTAPTAPTGWTAGAGYAAWKFDNSAYLNPPTLCFELTDATSPYSIAITGLGSGELYNVQTVTIWTKPDGSTAYGVSAPVTHSTS